MICQGNFKLFGIILFFVTKNDDEPEFSYFSWLVMLFAAGMGTGLVFWGVAEPLNHYMNAHYAEPETAAAMHEAIRYSFFHWGLHPWAIYLVLALPIAYYHFRIGLPLARRSVLWPIIGKRIYGMSGHIADILCTVDTTLLIVGGLLAIQQAAITMVLPMTLLLVACYGMIQAFTADVAQKGIPKQERIEGEVGED